MTGGYLGIGFDQYGNFYADNEGKGVGCPAGQRAPQGTQRIPNSVTIRGRGTGVTGYCYLAATATDPPAGPASTLPGNLTGTTLANARRGVHLLVTPGPAPQITVDMDFGSGFVRVLGPVPAPPNPPATYKFGYSGSTGGQMAVHLLRNAVVHTVDPLPPLNLVKQVDLENPLPPSLRAGQSIPYQFVVTNAGTGPVHDLSVTDPLVTNVSCPVTTLPAAPAPGNTVVCRGSYTVTTADEQAGEVTSQATATALDAGNTPVTSPPSLVTVHLQPQLTITKTIATPGPYRLGQTLTYNFALENIGTGALQNLIVSDTLAATVTCAASQLNPGQTTTCTGQHTLAAADIGPDGNVTSRAVAQAVTDLLQLAVTAPADVTVPVAANITLAATAEPASVGIGGEATFTVTATNTGPSAAANVHISNPVPSGVTLISATASTGNYDPNTGIWTIPNLAVGTPATLILHVRVEQPGPIANIATLTALDQPNLNSSQNSASVAINNAPITPPGVAPTGPGTVNQLGVTGFNLQHWLATALAALLSGALLLATNRLQTHRTPHPPPPNRRQSRRND